MIFVSNILRKVCTYTGLASATLSLAEYTKSLHKHSQDNQNLPDADSRAQQIFQEALQECGLQNKRYPLKIDTSNKPTFSITAVSVNTLKLNHNYLNTKTNKKELEIKQMLKHEIAHLHHHDSYSCFRISATISTALYTVSRLLNACLPTPRTPMQAVLLSTPMVLTAYGQVYLGPLLYKHLGHANGKLQEKRADDFAIRHTSDPQELQAAADFYEANLRDGIRQSIDSAIPAPKEAVEAATVATAKEICVENIMGQLLDIPLPERARRIAIHQRTHLIDSSKNSFATKIVPLSWFIPDEENLRISAEHLLKTVPLALPPSIENQLKNPPPDAIHPSDYERMMTFHAAAQRLRNPSPPQPGSALAPEPRIEFP